MWNREFNDDSGDEGVYGDDPLASVAVTICENCGATGGHIERIWTDDGTKPLLCEACAKEVRRIERIADELATEPSCPERQQIIDTAETTAGLVNSLQAHDREHCSECALARASDATNRATLERAGASCAEKVA